MAQILTMEQAIAQELRRRILGGELATGGQILQGLIAQEFGVSRAPVRDALRVLEGEDLVRYEPHRGYRVAELDWPELVEIHGMRELLEEEALRDACSAIRDEDLAAMAELEHRMAESAAAGDMASWVEDHRRFHFLLFDAGSGEYLSRILTQLWNRADVYRSRYLRTTVGREVAAQQHSALLSAAKSRDTDELLSVMSAHRRATLDSLRSEIDSDPVAVPGPEQQLGDT